jgi:type I restriction enzyme S subunit
MNQVTRSSLSQGLLKTCDVPIPPLEEQQVIASYLQKFLEKIDVIVNSETERCRLLREYRQSLISSVVTGKVRVTEDMI